MVLDSSAVVAVLAGEREAERLARAMATARRRLMSAVSVLECGIVLEARHGGEGGRNLDLLLKRADIRVISFTTAQADQARDAWRRFGKGRHPAGLNFGDCCSYALARESGEKLLFKGNDFGLTDVAAAPY
jgi:ribonuclease VapC